MKKLTKVSELSRRSGTVVAMNGRHPRKQVMRHRCERRAKDAGKHWSKDW